MLESPLALVQRLPAPVRLLLLGTLVNRSGTFIVPYLSLVLRRELHMSAAGAGMLISSYGAGSLVSILAGGVLTDVLGRRATLLFSLGGSGVLAVTMALSPGVRVFVPLLVAFGFVAELYRPASTAMISDLLPSRDRATGFAALRVAVNLGFAVGMTLGGALVDRHWRLMFVADGATTLLFGGLIFLFSRETMPAHAGGNATVPLRSFGAWRDGVFAQALVVSLAFGFVLFSFITVLPLTVTSWAGYPGVVYGAIVAVNGIIIALLEVSMVPWLRRFRRLRVAALGLVLGGLGFATTGLVPHWTCFLASLAVWTMGEILVVPQQMSFLADWAPPAARGRYMGLYSAAWSLGYAINPILLIPLHARVGDRLFWILIGLVLVPAAAVPWRLDRRADRPELLRGRTAEPAAR